MQKRACDQCYNKKKRCLICPASSICVRCEKSSLACTVSRQQLHGGRPPKQGLPGVAKESLAVWDYALSAGSPEEEAREEPQLVIKSSSVKESGERSPESTHLGFPRHLEVVDFYLLNNIYMFGFTFAEDFQQVLEYCHRYSPGLLDEIFTAITSGLS